MYTIWVNFRLHNLPVTVHFLNISVNAFMHRRTYFYLTNNLVCCYSEIVKAVWQFATLKTQASIGEQISKCKIVEVEIYLVIFVVISWSLVPYVSIIVSKTLRINAVFLLEIFFPLSLTFAHSPDGGKVNITMSVKDQITKFWSILT